MGLLDDAIREHLELKRRRGADPSEVSQQEQEALGPVRRDLAPEPGEELVDLPPGEEPVAYDERPETQVDPPAFPGEDVGAPDDDSAPPGAFYDAAADFEDGPPTEYIAPPTTEAPSADGPADEWGFDDDEERAAEEPAPEQPDEDVLEETPDFLQESPEHDRLWFEQKPPRDFDFDG